MKSEAIVSPHPWRWLLAAATLLAVTMACLPRPPALPGDPPDIILHATAFMVLTLLARAAYPYTRAWKILSGLGALGAAIEMLQAIPMLGRDASLLDWLVDLLAIAAALALLRCLTLWMSRSSKGASEGAG